jgi:N-acetyl sugar amidotransferase
LSNVFRECRRCVMNNAIDVEIRFNADDLCHHCQRYDATHQDRLFHDQPEKLEQLIKTIKRKGRGRQYDCLIGVSGGVDSTYVALLTKQYGLRPLAVHLDNGWNSEVAVSNIFKCMKGLDIDLHTEVLNWREFKALQLAFIRAGVPDGEVPTDHAIFATMWKFARKFKIPTILSGMNYHTESISVPNWSYGHSDFRYINAINKRFGTSELKTYPHFSLWYLLYLNATGAVKTASILNYLPYDKQQVKQRIQDELGWVDYGGKHHESLYTRFYQGHVLPVYFNIDKRYGHLSDMINAKQKTRDDALRELEEPTYSIDMQEKDLAFVTSKFDMEKDELLEILNGPKRSFRDFPNQQGLLTTFKTAVNTLRKFGLYPR